MNPQVSIQIDPKQSVASIVLAHSECAPLFQHLRIDFCCKGEQSLETACAARELSVTDVIQDLSAAIDDRAELSEDPASMTNATLISHIVSTHHEYLRKTMPFVSGLARKVARVHGDRNPRLIAVNETVEKLEAALIPHLIQEEQELFPSLLSPTADGAAVKAELVRMKAEHTEVGALLERLRDEAEQFVWPDWACNSYRTLFSELKQLELDTLRHVHLENHVLAPNFA
jgi:regulator of cell morphogenesis and NO signaling